jgi:hypothetical protein
MIENNSENRISWVFPPPRRSAPWFCPIERIFISDVSLASPIHGTIWFEGFFFSVNLAIGINLTWFLCIYCSLTWKIRILKLQEVNVRRVRGPVPACTLDASDPPVDGPGSHLTKAPCLCWTNSPVGCNNLGNALAVTHLQYHVTYYELRPSTGRSPICRLK